MTEERLKFRRKKQTLTLVHILFVTIAVSGIGTMYLNSNYGRGIKWIYEEAYEDSPSFIAQLASDVECVFTYAGYKGMLETDGGLNMNKVIVSYINGPGETAEMILDETVRYIKKRDYYLDENFELEGSPISMDDRDNEEITVDFQSINPDSVDVDVSGERTIKEDSVLDILNHLGEYYAIYNSYVENETNLRFRIVYRNDSGEEGVYVNVEDMSLEDLKGAGKCPYILGNSIKMETNMPTAPKNVATLPRIWNPNENDNYYMVISVGTAHLCMDVYSMVAWEHSGGRQNLILGIGGTIAGVLGCIVTPVALILMLGHSTPGNDGTRLFPIDEICTELCVTVWAALTALFLLGGECVGVHLFSLFVIEGQWSYWNKAIKIAITYGCLVLFSFNMLRRYRVRTLWSSSLLKKVIDTFRGYARHITSVAGTGFYYFLFLGINTVMLWGILPLFGYEGERFGFRVLLYELAAVPLATDGCIFYQMFKKAVQRDISGMAISSTSQGNTRYQIEMGSLIDKGRDTGEHLNNTSSGLDSALQQQVESERLRTDLVTNVSHDIKTPLTSIINYMDLLRREKIQDPKIMAYPEVLDQKSQRPKTLTEDLAEASKVSSSNMKLNIFGTDLAELVRQINGEFEERLVIRRLELVYNVPNEVLIIRADERRPWRVLENLYTNTVRYAMEHSRMYMDVLEEDGKVVFTIKSASESPLNARPDELTERSVRGDVAETAEGSGLGLSIAKSLAELQNGQFQVIIDGDLFRAMVSLPVMHAEYRTERIDVDPASVRAAVAEKTEQEEARRDNVVADAELIEVGDSSNHSRNEGES